jgi:hypothetical protein
MGMVLRILYDMDIYNWALNLEFLGNFSVTA